MAGDQGDSRTGRPLVGMPLSQRLQALGHDPATAETMGQRVTADMGTMLRKFGLEAERLRATAPLETLVAETRCAACPDPERCHRHLAGAPDDPALFCPNARLFGELARETENL